MLGTINSNVPSTDFSLFGGAESTTPELELEDTSRLRTVIPNGRLHKEFVSQSRTPQDPSDFLWLMTEEPHRSRRKAILKTHPEVVKLMGYTSTTKYVVFLVVLTQLICAHYLRNVDPFSLKFLLISYVIGGTMNHNLFLAIHEISHNLAFPGIKANKLLAFLANLPIGVPYAVTFKQYHLEHHKHLGEDGIDTDLPTKLELYCLNHVLGKAFFCTFQIFFYALRPGLVRTQRPTIWHGINIIVQFIFDIALINFWGWGAFYYLLASSFFAGSLHPMSGHFIAEHYLWDGLEQETYSYYGPLNWLAYNVGYHNEHHDFPSIPWTRLPELRRMVPEVYDTLPSHPSWPLVIWNFIIDPQVGMFSRVKRKAMEKGR